METSPPSDAGASSPGPGAAPPEDADLLLSLAPIDLPVLRILRYDGGGLGVRLADFAEQDQRLLEDIYRRVKGHYDLWLAMGGQPDYARLRAHLDALGTDRFVTE